MQEQIPRRLQGILWSKSLDKLDLQADRVYIIHQILAFGDMKAIAWLIKIYGKETLAQVFIDSPIKIYEPAIFHFVKDVVLDLSAYSLLPSRYVKIPPSNSIRPAAGNATPVG